MENGRVASAWGWSAVLPPLRTHTRTWYCEFADDGVQSNVSSVLQSATVAHAAPLYTGQLKSLRPVPPVASALKVIVVPGCCGAGRLAVIVTAVTGLPLLMSSIRNGIVACASAPSTVLLPLRPQTAIWYCEFAADGVHVKVFAVLHPARVDHAPFSNTCHLNWFDASPPLALAVNVIDVPTFCGGVLSAESVTPVIRLAGASIGNDTVASASA